MKIACIISGLVFGGGAEKVFAQILCHWAAKGWDVHVITLQPASELEAFPLPQSISRHPLNLSGGNRSLGRRVWRSCRRIVKMRKTISAIAPDVILSFMTEANLLALLATFGLGMPRIISERTDPRYHCLPRFVQSLRRFLYPFADRLVVQTQSVANSFHYCKNISIIPNSISPFSQKEKKSKFFSQKKIITIGRFIIEQKGQDLLLRAFSHISAAFPQWELICYGEGPDRPLLEELAATLDLSDKIAFPGYLHYEKALATGDLFVLPSRLEGFPNALCEAMAYGMPVIATQCSGSDEIIQHGINGLLVPREEIDALAQAMKQLLSNQKLAWKLSQKALEVTDRYSFDTIHVLWDNTALQCANKGIENAHCRN